MYNKFKISISSVLIALSFSACISNNSSKQSNKLLKQKEILLGQQLFFDKLLSKNNNQSCATCHNPEHAFVDNRDNIVSKAASLGDDLKSIGDRNAPTAAYAMFSPKFHYNKKKKQFIGGQFHDGRENDLKGQAGGPPTNPVEMAIPNKEFLVKRLKNNKNYNKQFKEIYGKDIFKNVNDVYGNMAQAIAAFEKTELFAPFDSKYDRFLNNEYDLTVLEDLGRSLFFSQKNNNCASCHLLKKEDAKRETFTNYQYHNIGVPKNHDLNSKNVVNAKTFVDHGLMNNPAVKNLKNANEYDGKFKVPTLRNVAVTAPYMHNGVFKDLRTVVEFYDKYINTNRTINPQTNKKWQEPEVEIQKDDLKLLKEGKKLNDRKIKALIAFMNTLTDKRYEHLIKENK